MFVDCVSAWVCRLYADFGVSRQRSSCEIVLVWSICVYLCVYLYVCVCVCVCVCVRVWAFRSPIPYALNNVSCTRKHTNLIYAQKNSMLHMRKRSLYMHKRTPYYVCAKEPCICAQEAYRLSPMYGHQQRGLFQECWTSGISKRPSSKYHELI